MSHSIREDGGVDAVPTTPVQGSLLKVFRLAVEEEGLPTQPPDQLRGIDGRDTPRLEGGPKLFTIAFVAAIRQPE